MSAAALVDGTGLAPVQGETLGPCGCPLWGRCAVNGGMRGGCGNSVDDKQTEFRLAASGDLFGEVDVYKAAIVAETLTGRNSRETI